MKHAQELKTLLDSGITIQEVASRLGIKVSYANMIRSRMKIEAPACSETSKARRIMDIAKLMGEGKSDWEIANALDISAQRLAYLQLGGGLREPRKRGRKPNSAQRPEQIKKLLGEGKSAPEVAKELGIKPNTIYQVCSRNKIPIPKSSSARKKALDAEIIRLRELGINDAGVAHITGLNPDLLYTYQPKGRGRPKNSNDELVIEALRRGDSVDEISLSLNLMPGTVINYGRRHGFSFKKSYVLKEGGVA
jgi:hypothetical protein